jgi:hypothetical protein
VQEGLRRGTTEGNEDSNMGDAIQINRMAERFSSHTLSHSRPAGRRSSRDLKALRERLIQAIVEVVAEGGDPRLGKSRALP